jgi:hypothetical protein
VRKHSDDNNKHRVAALFGGGGTDAKAGVLSRTITHPRLRSQ